MTFQPFVILQILVIIPLTLSTLYIFFYALAGLFYRQPPYVQNPTLRRIAVLIPGYQEDEVIIEVVIDALSQNYPKDLFEVVVIADSFLPMTMKTLMSLPITVIEVAFDRRTKAKALNKAMEQLPGHYDIALILDADNLMTPGFLTKINAAFESGIMAVQGHRTAKKQHSSLALLDAISEEINNHIFRKGHRAIGLSSALIGSGMAFQYDFFKHLMHGITAIGGFDKEIELKLLKDKILIEYLDDALVYDEKTGNAHDFSNQRRRWLAAQYHYFRADFFASVKAFLMEGNIGYFQKTIQFLQPPRILLLGTVAIVGTSAIIINGYLGYYFILNYFWTGIMVLCLLSFLFSIPRRFYHFSTLKALSSLPQGMFLMLRALMQIKGANKQFLHTKHTGLQTR
ncbi:MAG: glycosyltransferase family 2 protein [Bacteroidetes bacterium]|nr:glycosyltransferase family 2 protein [Bacteroidota bacterium]